MESRPLNTLSKYKIRYLNTKYLIKLIPININTSIGIDIINILIETPATGSLRLVCLQSQAVISLWHLSSSLGGAPGTRAVGLFGPVRWQQSRLATHQINMVCHTWFICMWGEPGRPQRSWLICHLQSPPRVSPGNFPATAVPYFQTVLFDGSDDMQSDAEWRGPAPRENCGCCRGCCCVYAAHTCYLRLLLHFLFPAQKYDTLPEVWHMQNGAHVHVCQGRALTETLTDGVWSLRPPLPTEQWVLSTALVSNLIKMNSVAFLRWCKGHSDQSEVGSIYCQCHFLREWAEIRKFC